MTGSEQTTERGGRSDVISVHGPEAVTFLQGQLSQDIEALGVGDTSLSLLLQPNGKLGWLIEIARRGEEAFDLAVDAGFGSAVIERLDRFKLRTKATLDLVDALDLDTPELEVEPSVATRIELGRPAMGYEIVDGVIPAELGPSLIESTVSFTKGCYTGQELVARIESRGGNTPRRLRGLVLDGARPPVRGADVYVDEEVVGSVTSAAFSDALGAPIALAFVKRGVQPPAAATVDDDGDRMSAEIRELPLISR